MITKERLEKLGFVLKTYPDGKFYLLEFDSEHFLQLPEDLSNISYYNDGWVDDNLTNSEFERVILKHSKEDM